ncbi:MAG: hypothetical protein WCW78_03240 [Candidatus Paceibacterota bacterium]|jgi:hypothetical protein
MHNVFWGIWLQTEANIEKLIDEQVRMLLTYIEEHKECFPQIHVRLPHHSGDTSEVEHSLIHLGDKMGYKNKHLYSLSYASHSAYRVARECTKEEVTHLVRNPQFIKNIVDIVSVFSKQEEEKKKKQ